MSACRKDDTGLVCYPGQDYCVDGQGNKVNPDGSPFDDGSVDPTDGVGTDTDPNTGTDQDDVVDPSDVCECTVTSTDSDGDCITDTKERGVANDSSDPTKRDTDGDGILDGCEDKNFNGIVDAGESDPSKTDTDGDCIPDGTEDKNHNGRFDLARGETSPVLLDSDKDGITDHNEDPNCDGVVQAYTDSNGNGCWDVTEPQGETNGALADTDGDGIGDGKEDKSNDGHCDADENSCPFVVDTDCDGIPDGYEDKNKSGTFNTGETYPRNTDTDGDGIPDGIEDANHNGVFEVGIETDPRSIDSDGDKIPDGSEDLDHDGIVDAAPRGSDGCWTRTAAGETDPRKADSDGDGIRDDVEDNNKNGQCDLGSVTDSQGTRPNDLIESCAFLADSDCDGISDGAEDKNHNAIHDLGETDAKFNDTDHDGLIDGCPPAYDFTRCEDLDNDGVVDVAESDPRSIDTDLDGLNDRCEVQFSATNCSTATCYTLATADDTDGDGKSDGEEDANHNCVYEPNLGETDPRVGNPAAAPGTIEYPRSQVCDSQNLKQLTFAGAPDPAVDYKVALEVEVFSQQTASYAVEAFGVELSGGDGVIDINNPNDMVWGHLFESPKGVVVDASTGAAVNRNIYGFAYATEDTTPLDTNLDALRDKLASMYAATGGSVEVSNVPERPAHDSIAAFPVTRAQRQFRIRVATDGSSARSALFVRADVLKQAFIPTAEQANLRPTTVLNNTSADPTYGTVNCPVSQQCYQKYTVSVTAVQRPTQIGVDATGITLYVVALTPDDSTSSSIDTATRLYNDRLTRLEDLTGGSAVARFNAGLSSTCEDRNATKARADLLFVVDDSRSMQSVIDKLQQASRDAQSVLTANANNVDFRIAMTTTNPSVYGREFCGSPNLPSTTTSPTAPTFDPTIGCLSTSAYSTSLTNELQGKNARIATTNEADLFDYRLPGGGGTFYYEDTAWLDCDASVQGVNACTNTYSQTNSDFSVFFGSGGARKRLVGNAGFLGSSPDTACTTKSVDLTFNTSASGTNCDADPLTADCCERLVDECADGPRVLSSQMCDVIRAMGGRPNTSTESASARPNSSNESGSRSARRLIGSMLPAYPNSYAGTDKRFHMRIDCTPGGSLEACDSDADCGKFDSCDRSALDSDGRGKCVGYGNCPATNVGCYPQEGTKVVGPANTIINEIEHPATAGASCAKNGSCDCSVDTDCGRGERCGLAGTCIRDCAPVPLVTVVLTDEEDYYFKDECAVSPTTARAPGQPGWERFAEDAADQSALATDCYYRKSGAPAPGPCYDDANDLAHVLDYCSTFASVATPPTNYNPDASPATENQVMQWRTATATQCQSVTPTPPSAGTATGGTCTANPCRLATTQTACGNLGSACSWEATSGLCVNYCEHYTANISGTPNRQTRLQQRSDCEADTRCEFDDSFSRDGFQNALANNLAINEQRWACQPKVPLNDCQACKRVIRQYQSLLGQDVTANNTNDELIGFGAVGPVYSIIRDRGQQGFLTELQSGGVVQDQCAGGEITWGRGDGQAFRDLATSTLGRAQNVCAANYQDFMQLLVTDIVALSAPYPLSQPPIAATIKVGLGRKNSDGTYRYIEVPRSRTRGFIYDSTSNSLGFKSDPIDGDCASGFSCTRTGVIEEGETKAAAASEVAPRQGDLVFISYRFWRPSPCPEGCATGYTCSRELCPADPTPGGACTVDSQCPSFRKCIEGTCQASCTADGYVEACIPNPCGQCQSGSAGNCTNLGTCECYSGAGIPCDPTAQNDSCPPGLSCDEQCFCEPVTGCENAFNLDGTPKDCDLALQCCRQPGANCCLTGEEPTCYTPIEDPSRKVFACVGGECTCEQTTATCTTDVDCAGNLDSSGNGAGSCLLGLDGAKHCTCSAAQICLQDSGGNCGCKLPPG